jgi:mannose-6-phosphate isomerase-like protein (cupin superfamily)
MAVASAKTGSWTRAALSERLVRYGELIPCYNAFIDCRSPGSEAKENFTIIGPGVSENPAQHVHIAEPHGFNIGGARQPLGCVNSQHSHDTAEVFVAHTGHWRFDLGEHGDDAHVDLHPGDVISIPTRMFRGFTALALADDGSPGFLWAVLGQDNPGRVTWAPQVFEMAKDFGLVLLENGALIDTAAGERVPNDAKPMQPTSHAEAIALQRVVEAEAIVFRCDKTEGSSVTAIVGEAGPLDWDHGFSIERFDIAAGEEIGWDGDDGVDVVFIHRGSAIIPCADGTLNVGPGDTLSLPIGLPRLLRSDEGAIVFLVHRS